MSLAKVYARAIYKGEYTGEVPEKRKQKVTEVLNKLKAKGEKYGKSTETV